MEVPMSVYEKNLISVIVPVYNTEKYLCTCIESLLKQTYNKWEMILVDDGSTDTSGSICDKYAERFENIYVVHKKNAGLGMARNTGIEHAKGEYITFFDSDDFADENLLEELYRGIVDNDGDACLGGFKKVDDNGNVLFEERYGFQIFEHDGITNRIFIKMLGSLPDTSDSVRMSVCNSLFKTSLIKDNNIRFYSERTYISEDLLFDLDFYKHVNKCIVLHNITYNYRYNPSSLTTSYRKDRFPSTMFFIKIMEERLIKENYSSECLLRLHKLCFVYVRTCIKQEKKKISHLPFKESIRNIRKICSDPKLNEIIFAYPVHKLGFKQKLFIYLIKKRLSCILYLLFKLGEILYDKKNIKKMYFRS